MTTDPRGQVLLADRYAHVADLAHGATGRVMHVRDVVTGAPWVAKAVSAQNAARLAAELDVLQDVFHGSIVRSRELLRVEAALEAPFALPAGTAVLIEELVVGEPLATARCASWEAVARVGEQLASGLAALHRVNVVHGDVSPHNVIAAETRTVLVDLGHAGAPLQGGLGASGTMGFMAPEAFAGVRTPATDLFGLGATLLSAAPTASPHGAPESFSEAHEHAQRLQQVARDALKDAPQPLAEIITALLAPSPERRPSDAQEVAVRFQWEQGETAQPNQTEELAPLRMRARRSGARLAGALRSARFVGHSDALQEALDAVRVRAQDTLPPTLVVVTGPAGSGRTRFAQELAQRLQRMAFDVGFPVPALVHAAQLPAQPGHPVIVHWVDERGDDTRALRFLDAAEVERCPSVVVRRGVGALPGQDSSQAAVDPRVLTVRLGPLPSAAISALLLDALGEDPMTHELDAAVALTGGLVGSLVQLLASSAIAGDFARARDLPSLRPADSGWTPPELPTATLELLEQASVCGDGLPLPGEVPEGLSQALTLGLLSLDRDGGVVARADVRAGMVAQMTAARRSSVASGLLQRVTAPLTRAHLAAQVGDYAVAESELQRGLRRDGAQGASVASVERVYELLQGLPDPSGEARRQVSAWLCRNTAWVRALDALAPATDLQSLCARAEVLRQSGDRRAAQEAVTLASQDPGAASSEAYLRSAGRLAVADPDAATPLGALLDAFAAQHPDTYGDSAAFLEVRALAAWTRLDLETADADADRAARQSLQQGSQGEAARCTSLRATIAQRRGDAASAYAHGRYALELASQAGDKLAAAVYGLNLGLACFELGNLGEALTHVRTGADQLAEVGQTRLLAQAALNLAHIHTAFGDDTAAAALLPLATRKANDGALLSVLAHADLTWAAIELRRGKHQASIARVEAALARTAVCGAEAQPLLLARAALAYAEAAQPERAQALLTDVALASADDNADASLTRRLAVGTLALGGDSVARQAAVLALTPAAADPRGWERQLQATLLMSLLLERLGDGPGALAEARRARTLLDAALDSLPNNLRPQLLEAVRYQAALRVAPLVDTPTRGHLGGRDAFRELPLYVQRFISAGAPARLLQRVADAAQALTRAERGFVVERQPDGQWVTLASTGDEPASARRFSRSVAGRALATGRTVSALDALEDTRLNTSASVLGIGTRSVLAAPLHCRGRHLVLYVDDRTRPAAFDQESEEVFAACAQLAGLALTASWDAAALRQEQEKLVAAEAALRTDVDSQRDELTTLRRAVLGTERGGMIAGPGPMRRALELAERAATSAIPVLILGESGTGKELVARFVHDQSARRNERFVSENCAAIPDTLLESALFGHERGAFTGADRARQGLFHSADGGTLFLDEIGEMSPAMQSKLLRVLQNGEVRSLGGTRVTRVDVRLVTATHRDLRAMVAAGQFREDLYYRITVVTLQLPPLRERTGDVPLLVRHFLRKHHEGATPRITSDAMQRLSTDPWPGNVRQLENEVQRLLVMAGDPIGVSDLAVPTQSPTAGDLTDDTLSGSLALREHVDHLERRLINTAMARTEGNQTRAALELGVSRYGLQKMMKRLGLRD